MNNENAEGVLPDRFDLSHGSLKTYLIELRHGLIPPCIHCHQFRPVLLDSDEYYQYFVAGKFNSVREAFPHNTPAEHELLMTGIHPACWDAIFDDEEE